MKLKTLTKQDLKIAQFELKHKTPNKEISSFLRTNSSQIAQVTQIHNFKIMLESFKRLLHRTTHKINYKSRKKRQQKESKAKEGGQRR